MFAKKEINIMEENQNIATPAPDPEPTVAVSDDGTRVAMVNPVEAPTQQEAPNQPLTPEIMSDEIPSNAPPRASDIIPFTKAGLIPSLLTNLRATLDNRYAEMTDISTRIKETTAQTVTVMETYAQEANSSLTDLTSELRKRGV